MSPCAGPRPRRDSGRETITPSAAARIACRSRSFACGSATSSGTSFAFKPNDQTVAGCEKSDKPFCFRQAFGNLTFHEGPEKALALLATDDSNIAAVHADAPTAEDTEMWHDSMRHIAREARAFVLSCYVFQRASSYPDDVPLAEGGELVGRGGSAILGPDGSYLAGPLWDEEGILYAELHPDLLLAERQRFDAAGHYHRPDVLGLDRKLSR